MFAQKLPLLVILRLRKALLSVPLPPGAGRRWGWHPLWGREGTDSQIVSPSLSPACGLVPKEDTLQPFPLPTVLLTCSWGRGGGGGSRRPGGMGVQALTLGSKLCVFDKHKSQFPWSFLVRFAFSRMVLIEWSPEKTLLRRMPCRWSTCCRREVTIKCDEDQLSFH